MAKNSKLDKLVLSTRKMTPDQLRRHLNTAHSARRIPGKNLESGARSTNRRRAVDEGLARL